MAKSVVCEIDPRQECKQQKGNGITLEYSSFSYIKFTWAWLRYSYHIKYTVDCTLKIRMLDESENRSKSFGFDPI